MGISIGLVGLGAFGSEFADLFMSHPLVDRVALCDREGDRVRRFAEKETWRKKFHPRDAYESFDAICAAKLDALAIITQPWLHAPQCIQAMESGKHVYSAVPVIWLPDGDEILDWCDKLVAACRRTGMRYMLGETTYYRPGAVFCRRKAKESAFGDFVYAEGEYYHDFESPSCNLKQVRAARLAGKAGEEWRRLAEQYLRRGSFTGPMHYPTHSTGGPICVMKCPAVKVSAFAYRTRTGDEFFGDSDGISNETALFLMRNGATMRICEHREIGRPGSETFRIFGTKASFGDDTWYDNASGVQLTTEQMRPPLDEEFVRAYAAADPGGSVYGEHGGSHGYLVDEFVRAVAEDRPPAIHVWEAVRYMAAGVMAHKSALRDGEMLEVPDWGDGPAS